MRPIDLIVIHCSASPNGRWTSVEDIDSWHRERGFKRDKGALTFNPRLAAIGYHFVIYTNGGLATGRSMAELGAHAAGWNQRSLGLCLVGTDKYTASQWQQLAAQVRHLAAQCNVPLSFPSFKAPSVRGICGHRDLPTVNKTCPGFNVRDWLASGMEPPPANLLPSSKGSA